MNALDKALSIISDEINKIQLLSQHSVSDDGNHSYHLDRSTAAILTDYVKVLVAVRKEERDSNKEDPLAVKTDEEIAALAEEAIKFLDIKPKPKKRVRVKK